ncbi:MAG: transposase [Thaumarchaeota archaeon]|nr:transposase [Nitrososphaerota archaeon]
MNLSANASMCDANEAQDRGYIQHVPHFTLPSKYLQKAELTPILQDLITLSALPLQSVETSFSIDASGISPALFSRWFDKKYGIVKDRKIWYKLHMVNGNATHVVTSCSVTTQHVHDTLLLEELTNETHEQFDMQQLCADRGYLSQQNLEHLNRLGVASYIPFKSNTIADNDKKSEIWRNAYNYFTFNQSAFLAHYHQRSNSETVFHMIKSKFSGSVRSKTETACINEILLKVLCHNICVLISEMFELGITPTFCMPSFSTKRGDFLQKTS